MASVIQFLYPDAVLIGNQRNVVVEQSAKDPDPVIVKWGLKEPQPSIKLLKSNLQSYLDAQTLKDKDQQMKQQDLKARLNLTDDDVKTLTQIINAAQ